MKNPWERKKILAYGKRFSVFTSIMLVLLFAFSCSNLIMNDGGSLIIAVPGARAASASSYTIELTGSNGTPQRKNVAGGTTAQFDDLAPDTYTISVKGTNERNVVVFGGSKSVVVKSGETASVMIALEALIGELTVNLSGTTATKYTIELKDSKGSTQNKEVFAAGDVKFDELPLGTYSISVTGSDDDTIVCFGTSSATIKAMEPASAMVSLAGIVNTLDQLKAAIPNGGIIYVGSDIEINATITETPSTPVTIQAAYKDVTLSWTGTTLPEAAMFEPTGGNWTFGGGEYSITLKGNSYSSHLINITSADTEVTLTSNGSIDINSSSVYGVAIGQDSSTNKSIFHLDGGKIIGKADTSVVVYGNSQFIMKRGSITATASKGVHVKAGSAFSMTGGDILNSTNDVFVEKSDLFTISGKVQVGTIKLNGIGVYFTVGGELEGNSTVATITPGRYDTNETVVKVAEDSDVTLDEVNTRFNVKPNGNTQWLIDDDGTLEPV